jgi:hypothetical protein
MVDILADNIDAMYPISAQHVQLDVGTMVELKCLNLVQLPPLPPPTLPPQNTWVTFFYERNVPVARCRPFLFLYTFEGELVLLTAPIFFFWKGGENED